MAVVADDAAATAVAPVIEVPLRDGSASIEIDTSELPEDLLEVSEILATEEAPARVWLQFAYEYRQRGMIGHATELLTQGINSLGSFSPTETARLYANLAAIYLDQYRQTSSSSDDHDKTKQAFISSLNSATTLLPDWSVNTLLQGVWDCMQISQDRSSISTASQHLGMTRATAKSAASDNLLVMFCKARVLFSKESYKAALRLYQKILVARPNMRPDPRIGIGLCFYQLGKYADAVLAFERAHELDPSNKHAITLLGLSYGNQAFQHADSEDFIKFYTQALRYIQQAFKLDPQYPAPALFLASYMFSKKNADGVVKLTQRVLANTSMTSMLCDAHCWLGRAYHQMEMYDLAAVNYQRAKTLSESNIYAQIGLVQVQILQNDLTNARLNLERLIDSNNRCIEAYAILVALLMREISATSHPSHQSVVKAKSYIDRILLLAKETKHDILHMPTIYIMRAQLLERDQQLESLRDYETASELQKSQTGSVSPQLMNNCAVLQQQQGRYEAALQLYDQALAYLSSADLSETQVDQIKTSITYNIGRCNEQLGNTDAAMEKYKAVLEMHDDYSDARVRQCVLELSKPTESTFRAIRKLMESDSDNPEIRAFFGWYLSRQRRRLTDEPEMRHCQQTLRHWKDDGYAMTQLGNVYVTQAREASGDEGKRQKLYAKAMQMFEQALKVDSRNAHAAQGVACVLAYDRQFPKAMQVFSKLRETSRDVSTLINLGHCLAELKQYERAIESYETALKVQSGRDIYGINSCLGRVWIQRGREEKSIYCLEQALKYTEKALENDPRNDSMRFNVAFVQFQSAEVIRSLPEEKRSVGDVERAMELLNLSITTLTELQQSKNMPYAATDLDQRVKQLNTSKRQLERALQSQREFETSSMAKMDELRQFRLQEKARLEEEANERRRAEEERQRALAEERRKIQEEMAQIRRARQEELERLEDAEEEAPTKQKKRKGRKKQKKDFIVDDDEEDEEEDDDENKGIDEEKEEPEEHVANDGEAEDDVFGDSGENTPNSLKAENGKRPLSDRDSKERVASGDDGDDSAGDGDDDDDMTVHRRKKKKVLSTEFVDSDDEDKAMGNGQDA